MTARDVKQALYARHYASAAQMPGAWTCIEEFRGVDLLAFSAWSSAEKYARIGYEVKVSRSDMRRELLEPGKRTANVEWCNAFYFAVPKGLLTPEEIAYVEPDWPDDAFTRPVCPNDERINWGRRRRDRRCVERVPVPVVGHVWSRGGGVGWETLNCRICGGSGATDRSLVEKLAPTLWIPRDVGLVEIDGRGCHEVRKAPRRKDVPALNARELGQLVRFVSMRPDPRHVRATVAA